MHQAKEVESKHDEENGHSGSSEGPEVLCQVLKKSASHGKLLCKFMPATVKGGLPNPAAHRAQKTFLLQDGGCSPVTIQHSQNALVAAAAHVEMQHFSQPKKFGHYRQPPL